MKSVLNWLRSHSLKVLGVVLVILAVVAVWLGQLPVDTASMVGVAGLGMLGVSVRLDQVHSVASAAAASGVAYRSGGAAALRDEILRNPDLRRTLAEAIAAEQAKG